MGSPTSTASTQIPICGSGRCGLTIIWGLQSDGPDHWSNGSLYDPQDGNTYDLTAERTAPGTISARVYRGIPLLGRTEILIRDPQLTFDGRC